MKIKYIAAALVLSIAFSLTGCGAYDSNNEDSSDISNDAGRIANDIGKIFDGNNGNNGNNGSNGNNGGNSNSGSNNNNRGYNVDNNGIVNGFGGSNNTGSNAAGGGSILDGYNDPNFPNYLQDDLKNNDNNNYEANMAGEMNETTTKNTNGSR